MLTLIYYAYEKYVLMYFYRENRVLFTQLDVDGNPDGQLDRYCTPNASPNPIISPLPVPTGGVRTRFRTFENGPGQGFNVEICVVDCP